MIEATCPVLPISSRVLLPASVLRLTLGKQASLAMAEHLLEEKHEALSQQRGSDALSSPYSPFDPLNLVLFSLKRQMLIGIFTYVGKEEEEQVNIGTFLDSIGKSRIEPWRDREHQEKPSGGGGSISMTVQGLHRFEHQYCEARRFTWQGWIFLRMIQTLNSPMRKRACGQTCCI